MANDNETVREVCNDLKLLDGTLMIDETLGPYYPCVTAITTEQVGEYCDRILAAYDREMAEKDAEIARLKSALKPVIECANRIGDVFHCGDEYLALKAVREAQRVMREGGAE